MKWKTGFVLALTILAASTGVESVSGMVIDWEYELWSDVTELSVSDDGHVAALVSTSEVSDVYLFDKEGKLLWDREFECELYVDTTYFVGKTCDWFAISQDASHVIACEYYGPCYFLDKTGKILGQSSIWISHLTGLAISSNGKYMANVGYGYYEDRSSVFDITLINDLGELLWTCTVNTEESPIMSVSNNGEVIVGSDNAVKFLKDGRIIWKYEIKGYEDLEDVVMSPNGDYIVLSASSVKGDSIHTLDKSGNLINKKSVDFASDIFSVASEGTYNVISKDKMEIYDINNTLIEEQQFVETDAKLSPNAKYAASAQGKKIYFYNISKGTSATVLTSADAIWNNAISAVINVTSVQYDVDLTLTTEAGTVKDITHTEVDFEQRKSHTIHTGDIPGETYYIGNEIYTCMSGRCEKLDEVPPWDKESKLEELLGCGENADVTLIGSQKLDDKDCWILEVIPLDPLKGLNIGIKDWVSKEDYLPQKAEIAVTHEYTEGEEIATERTVIFYDYNKSLTIALPKKELSTPDSPGFEVVFAILGLLTVAYLIRRRNKNNRRY
ncbi:MAG: PGF-CTERM sorting domain-containing protein [Halobacteriota archaeon]